jgi:IS30 family transposase
LLLRPELADIVRAKLLLRWSPEQIAQWLKREYVDRTMHVAAETIYTYVYVLPRGELKAELLKALRRSHKFRRRRGRKAREPVVAIEDMLSIEERPAEVADRIVPGHWEGDLLVGGRREQSVLGTLVERTTRTVLLVPLEGKSAPEVRRAFAREMRRLPQQMRLSLTYDQGREMAQHKLFTKQTKMKVYFAHPRSPWERGTNENTNGLIRQFFPKGTNFRTISRREIKHVQDLLNGRPRKTLGFRTPYEAMQEVLR